MAQSWIMKHLRTILIAFVVVIVIVLVLGLVWLLKQDSSSKANFNFTISDSWNGVQMYSEEDKMQTNDNSCGEGWTKYKDEKCFKIIDETFQTFDEAGKSCAHLENNTELSILPIIESKEEQTFLTNHLFVSRKRVEGFWIGANYASNGSRFRWADSTDFSYTNWNAAKNSKAKANYCVQMQAEEDAIGKWISVPCGKNNAVVCQKMQKWSSARMQRTHLVARKTLEAANKRISDLERNLGEANSKIDKQSEALERNLEEINRKIDKKSGDWERNLGEAIRKMDKKTETLERNLEETNRKIDKKSDDLERNLGEANRKIDKKTETLERNLEETNSKIDKKSGDLERNLDEANRKIDKKTETLERNLEETNSKIDKKSGDLERNLGEANRKIDKKCGALESKLDETNRKISKDLIPIGFIYAQVPNEKSPGEIWTWMSWTDVSSAYAGVFFRVNGGGAASFGQVQPESCPRISHFTTFYDGPRVTMGTKAESRRMITDTQRYDAYNMNGIKFDVTTDEVRPRNMAIRIWKRTG